MSGPLHNCPFPKGRLSRAREYVISELRNNEILRSAVDDWHVWQGDIEDLQPTQVGNRTNAVSLELRSSGGQFQWTDETRHGGTWTITVEFYLPTTDESWACDAWEALYNAIPWPNLARHYPYLVEQYGCYEIVMVGPTLAPDEAAGGGGMRVTGSLNLLLNVDEYSTS